MQLRLSDEQLSELLDTGKVVGTAPWRHGHRDTYHVIHEGNDYLVTVDVHPSEGIQHYGEVTLTPAVQRTREITEWVPV